jgi:hypothetical protein
LSTIICFEVEGQIVCEREEELRFRELKEYIDMKIAEFWSYPPFRDVVGFDGTSSPEVNTADWSSLKTYTYTAKRELRVFELRVRTGVRLRNTGSKAESVELSALVNGETIVFLGSLVVDANSTLEDFIDVTSVVDVTTASKDIVVELRARTSSEACYVALTPPILVEIGYLLSPRQKYRRVGDKLMVIPESVLLQAEREELERSISERVLKKLEEEYELEIQVDPRTGRGSARIKKSGRK